MTIRQPSLRRRLGILLLVAILVLSGVAGVASAQSVERAGGTIVVGPNEVVNGDLQAVGGNVLIEGTVTGNVDATAGSVLISGSVGGDVESVAGSVVIEGTVGGDVSVAAGSLSVREDARIGGDLEAAAGAVRLAGQVGGDARLAGEEIVLAPTAVVGGGVEYDAATFTREPGASVAGPVTRNENLEVAVDSGFGFAIPEGATTGFQLPDWAVAVWGIVVNAALGAAVLLVAPGFVGRVTAYGRENTLVAGGMGLLAMVAVPVVLVVLLVTIVGIPLSLAGGVLFGLVLWLTAVLGAVVVGTWLTSLVDRDSQWLSLLVGVVAVGLVGLVPFVGGLLQFLVLLVGLGAFVQTLRTDEGDGEGETGTVTGGRPAA